MLNACHSLLRVLREERKLREAEESKRREEEARLMAEEQRLRDEAQRVDEEKEAQERARAEQEENKRLQKQVNKHPQLPADRGAVSVHPSVRLLFLLSTCFVTESLL